MNKDLSYGLNPRTNPKPSRKRQRLSGFDSDSSSSHEEETTGRSATNKAIAAEQNALRKRAQSALQTYDFDGEYDSFTKNKPVEKKKEDDKSSKYISKLLQSSQRRTREQEIIYERKIAKEQAAEEEEEGFEGKEKFITSAYKRKLAEREEWIKEEREREAKEKEEDVTKKTGGSFLMGGFGRNMLSGAVGDVEGKGSEKKTSENMERNDRHGDSSMDTERWGNTSRNRQPRDDDSNRYSNQMSSHSNASSANINDGTKSDKPETVLPKTRRQILEERAVKLRDARARYFQRKGLKPSQ